MDRYLIFGDPGDVALVRQQLEPLIRYFQSGGDGWKWLEDYKAAVKGMANQLEPLLRRIARLREDQAAVRNALNCIRPFDAPEWIERMENCRLGAHTRDPAAEPSPPQKRILGFLGGVAHD